MADQDHYRKLERMYLEAPTNGYYEPEVSVGEGNATIRIRVKEDFFHALDAVHGSVYFKALDDAAYFAAASLVPDVVVLTASFNLHLLLPVTDGVMAAEGTVLHRTRSAILAESRLFDAQGTLLAHGTGSFVRTKIALSPEIGYR